jgi:hypothetical protein
MGPRNYAASTYTRGPNCIDFRMGTQGPYFAAQRSGYLPFYAGAFSADHRPLFCDFDEAKLFRAITPELPSHATRAVKSTSRKIVKKYSKSNRNEIEPVTDGTQS